MRRAPVLLAFAGMLTIGAAGSGVAGERGIYGGYGGGYPYGAGGYGFADAAVSGAYIGAPFTRFPRPSELVAPALSYGTYGVPTVPGIRQAPIGQPVVYSIDSRSERLQRRSQRSRVLTRESSTWSEPGEEASSDAGGARVISVRTR